jgi:hypothetical protein
LENKFDKKLGVAKYTKRCKINLALQNKFGFGKSI